MASLHGAALQLRVHSLFVGAGLARVTVSRGSRAVVDIGARDAVAPGAATITGRRGPGVTSVTVSEVRAPEYARQLIAPGAAVIVRQGPRTLASTVPVPADQALPRQGTVSVRGSNYRGATQAFSGFGGMPVEVTVLSNVDATAASAGGSGVLAAVLIVAFLLLAAVFALLASRALHGQLGRFLEAARRVGSGDFSSRVRVEGRDEFAALGEEFNQMSGQLAQRIEELSSSSTSPTRCARPRVRSTSRLAMGARKWRWSCRTPISRAPTRSRNACGSPSNRCKFRCSTVQDSSALPPASAFRPVPTGTKTP